MFQVKLDRHGRLELAEGRVQKQPKSAGCRIDVLQSRKRYSYLLNSRNTKHTWKLTIMIEVIMTANKISLRTSVHTQYGTMEALDIILEHVNRLICLRHGRHFGGTLNHVRFQSG